MTLPINGDNIENSNYVKLFEVSLYNINNHGRMLIQCSCLLDLHLFPADLLFRYKAYIMIIVCMEMPNVNILRNVYDVLFLMMCANCFFRYSFRTTLGLYQSAEIN